MVNGGTLYRRLADAMRAQIITGELPPGADLPSEAQLCARWEVSRPTARAALQLLEAEGLADVHQGRRRTVRDRIVLVVHVTRTADRLYGAEAPTKGGDSWAADVAEAGHVPGQQIAILEGDSEAAAALGLAPGARVTVRDVLRTINGRPHNRQRFLFDTAIAENTPLARPENLPAGSMAWLAGHGHGPDRWTVTIETRTPRDDERRTLAPPPGDLLAEYRYGTRDARMMFICQTLWPGDTRLILDL